MPHQGQRTVRTQAQRFSILAAGRRWRKTSMAMTIAVERACAGQKVIWGAPVFDQVRVSWDETKRAAAAVADFNVSRMIATFPSGGAIIYRSLDNPDNVRGHTADGVVVDEASDVAADAWHEVLRPMLIDTQGWGWIIGTPKRRNWFWREWMRAIDAADMACWQAPTVGATINGTTLVRTPHPLENPFIPWVEIINLYETLPEETFRQELLAEFIEEDGAVFRNITANLTAPPDADPADHIGHTFACGIDWGQRNDYTAISIVCVDCACEVVLDRFNKIDWHFQRGRLRSAHDLWQVQVALAESNSIGGPNIEALQLEGMNVYPFETTASSKPPLIKSLALALERCEMRWLDVPAATAELHAYESKASATTGRLSYSAPSGMHDDTVIARALALECAINPPQPDGILTYESRVSISAY